MIENWPLLTIITFLPMIGVLFLLMIRGDEQSVARNARHVALWVSGFTFIISLALVFGFDSTSTVISLRKTAPGCRLPVSAITLVLMAFRCRSSCCRHCCRRWRFWPAGRPSRTVFANI
jgi:NADH:ubiquinone oxidoreductase subunit 4 (subunit M)